MELEPTTAAADFAALAEAAVELLLAATTLTVTSPVIVPSVDVTVSVSDSTVLSVTWNVATPLVNVTLLGTVMLVSDDVTVAVPV